MIISLNKHFGINFTVIIVIVIITCTFIAAIASSIVIIVFTMHFITAMKLR